MDMLMRQPSSKIVLSGFCDQARLQYYSSNPAIYKLMGMKTRVGGKQEKAPKKKKLKKQLKLVKGLSRDLSAFSQMGFPLDSDGSEASELVLEQLKAEQKELKKKMKQEEARLKVHNSSSSESSDSECGGEVIDINSLKKHKLSKQKQLVQIMQPNVPGTNPEETIAMASELKSWKKIQVCMGGKCKKSGGWALLEKLKGVIGIEGAVSGCKCMGKCRDGPNLKVFNHHHFDGDSVPTTMSNSLCIGVGLEDVDMIVSNFLAQNRNQLGKK